MQVFGVHVAKRFWSFGLLWPPAAAHEADQNRLGWSLCWTGRSTADISIKCVFFTHFRRFWASLFWSHVRVKRVKSNWRVVLKENPVFQNKTYFGAWSLIRQKLNTLLLFVLYLLFICSPVPTAVLYRPRPGGWGPLVLTTCNYSRPGESTLSTDRWWMSLHMMLSASFPLVLYVSVTEWTRLSSDRQQPKPRDDSRTHCDTTWAGS